MIKKFEMVFVVLVYRNYEDLYPFFKSINKTIFDEYKVIIIDSFYSQEVSNQIKSIALENNADYLSVPNRGYGAGNNAGIKHAMAKYSFEYLIISNPDIEITKFNHEILLKKYTCIAPIIATKTGKMQNPFWAVENGFAEKMIYKGFKSNSKFFLYLGIGINKIIRNIFLHHLEKVSGYEKKIYAAHGSFLLISYEFLHSTQFEYDNKMFLFYEEAVLAKVLKDKNQVITFTDEICILHNEDGSMNLANINEYKFLKESYVYYYEKYRL